MDKINQFPGIVDLVRFQDAIFVRFADGISALYPDSLMHSMRSQAQLVPNGSTDIDGMGDQDDDADELDTRRRSK